MVSSLSGVKHGNCAGNILRTGSSTIRKSFLSFPRRCRNGVPPGPSSRCAPGAVPCRTAISFCSFRTRPGSVPPRTSRARRRSICTRRQLPVTVFASAPGQAAHLEQDWTPSERALAIDLAALAEGGSVIFLEATGNLPGLKGRLNPIRDTHDRTYLYASNIAINEGQQQPVHFIPGEELQLTDAEGTGLRVRIVDIVGRSALIEYFDAR